MTQSVLLRGMAWDHPRALNPLEAISAEWSKTSGVDIAWDARSLKEFEDQPLEELTEHYDLLLIDYPFVGFAAGSGLIVPVNDWVDADYLADQARMSVGPSYASYTWSGKQWALAVDAACQVSAVRPDLLSAVGCDPLPNRWDDVAGMAMSSSRDAPRVAMPLNPNHAYCAFIAIGVSLADTCFWPAGKSVDRSAGLESLHFLRSLATRLHEVSRMSDPIAISDRMTETDEIFYVPLMFGYSSYSRYGFRSHRLQFGDAPCGSSGRIGSVLGGVGIALSQRSSNKAAASDLARLIASPDIQSGIYARSGGQPAHAAAWESADANRATKDFFKATRMTMDEAFLRPRVAGHPRFQQRAGELIHGFVWTSDPSAEDCLGGYERLADEYLSGGEEQRHG